MSDARRKYAVKRELILLLYERGYSAAYTESLLRFLDWLIRLLEAGEQKLSREIEQTRGEKRMPYVTSWERIAEKRGRKKGREEGRLELVLEQLPKKIGALDARLTARVQQLSPAQLTQLSEALLDFPAGGFGDVADAQRRLKLGREAVPHVKTHGRQ